MAQTRRSPGLPDDQNDRVIAKIQEIAARDQWRQRGGITALARSLGLTQARMSQLINNRSQRGEGQERVSRDTAERVARFEGVDFDELVMGLPMKFPNLKQTLGYWGQDRWHPAVVAAAWAGWWEDDVSPPEWADRLDTLEKQRKPQGKKPQRS